jgi:tetratricopeptide (TPR) repeat protein
MWGTAAVVALLAIGAPALAAQAPALDVLAQAQRLRDAGDLAAAAQVLKTQLAREPNNGDVARLLAQTLYWLQDVTGAQAVYETALARHPQDTTLRLQYGRLLVETGQPARARALLVPLQRVPPAQTEATALLGTLAYWEGDLTTARRFFDEVLRAEPTHVEARRQFEEIRAASAPWVRVFSGLSHDDQPLDRLALGVEAGWFPTPLLPVSVRVEPTWYRLDDSTSRRILAADAAVSHFAPALRLETQLAGGMFQRSRRAEGTDWKGRAGVGVRLPRHVTLRVRAERAPYLYTLSSLDAPVIVRSGTALVHWQDPRGWLGEGAYQHQRFPDGNTIRTVYAWQLAPLVYRAMAELQAGYSFTTEHTDESRFVLASPTQPYPPGDPLFSTAGRYAPYYTPSNLVSHSVIAAAALRPSDRATLRVGATYALRATEEAPAFVVSLGQVQRTLTSRELSPWNARGSIDVMLSRDATLTATGEHGRTAFYEWSTAGLQITYRFRTAR